MLVACWGLVNICPVITTGFCISNNFIKYPQHSLQSNETQQPPITLFADIQNTEKRTTLEQTFQWSETETVTAVGASIDVHWSVENENMYGLNEAWDSTVLCPCVGWPSGERWLVLRSAGWHHGEVWPGPLSAVSRCTLHPLILCPSLSRSPTLHLRIVALVS